MNTDHYKKATLIFMGKANTPLFKLYQDAGRI
jgi:hypothetical protein